MYSHGKVAGLILCSVGIESPCGNCCWFLAASRGVKMARDFSFQFPRFLSPLIALSSIHKPRCFCKVRYLPFVPSVLAPFVHENLLRLFCNSTNETEEREQPLSNATRNVTKGSIRVENSWYYNLFETNTFRFPFRTNEN